MSPNSGGFRNNTVISLFQQLKLILLLSILTALMEHQDLPQVVSWEVRSALALDQAKALDLELALELDLELVLALGLDLEQEEEADSVLLKEDFELKATLSSP